MDDVPGTPGTARVVAGRYHLTGALAEDVTGVLWRARDDMLGRDVAIREVRAADPDDAEGSRRLYEHLENAARSAGRVSHRNVVAVHDVATEDGRPWIVTELVRGITLSDALEAEGPLPERRAAHIGAEVLAALRAAHAAGVLHKDVKPSNVLLANDGRVLVTDFGTVAADGSPEFAAPETAAGRAPGPESDLWSLGAMLHAAVEGRSAFGPGDREHGPSGATGGLRQVIAGLLHRNPADRLDAAEAEHLLRLASAGGGAQPDPSAATPSPRAAQDPARERDTASPPARAVSAPAVQESDDSRQAAAVLTAGVTLLVLFVAALVWAVAELA